MMKSIQIYYKYNFLSDPFQNISYINRFILAKIYKDIRSNNPMAIDRFW